MAQIFCSPVIPCAAWPQSKAYVDQPAASCVAEELFLLTRPMCTELLCLVFI